MAIRAYAWSLILAASLSACQLTGAQNKSPDQPDLPPLAAEVADPFAHAWDDFEIFDASLAEDEPTRNAPLNSATVYHLDIVLADDMLSLSGRQAARFYNPLPRPLETLYLRLFPNLTGGRITVSEIRIDDQPCESTISSGDSVLGVSLPKPLPPGQALVLKLAFDLKLPQTMEGNYGLFGYHDGILLLQEFHPMIPALTDSGWSLEVPPPFGDLTHQPASYYLLRLRVPQDLILFSSGSQLQRAIQGTEQVILIANGPARVLYLAGARDLASDSGIVEGTRIISYAEPDWSDTAHQVTEISANALRFFERLLSPYPYSEMELFATPMQALGMEYPGVIALTDRMFDPQAAIGELPGSAYLEGTVVHEVAHQWFYNLIGNDQIEAPWLDEALVQYVTGLYFKDRYGQEGYDQFRSSWLSRWDRVDRDPIPIGLPSADYTDVEYGAIVYGRGPLFIEALADRMGEAAFQHFLKHYVEQYRWDFGTPDEFERLAEQTCSCDLTPLFETWVNPN
jgi:hypothetical protein